MFYWFSKEILLVGSVVRGAVGGLEGGGVTTCCIRGGRRIIPLVGRVIPRNDDISGNNDRDLIRYNIFSLLRDKCCSFVSHHGCSTRAIHRYCVGTFKYSTFFYSSGTMARGNRLCGISNGSGHITYVICKPRGIVVIINGGGVIPSVRTTIGEIGGVSTPLGAGELRYGAPYRSANRYLDLTGRNTRVYTNYRDPRHVYYGCIISTQRERGGEVGIVVINRRLKCWTLLVVFVGTFVGC